ncbi:MAG TPA: anaerobic ribonucleoside-triphosphate reductase activating protein, partial [Fibrobacter sp.]|nr:anaerobic ribonucleoside-triphosphate reductase activating protein [Fibrobacter sp.]
MKIQGLQRISLLDYPEHIACTVFTPNCNFRCPFCHNASLVLPEKISEDFISEEYFFEFLSSRKNKLEAVCISGGEPLLQKDIEYFMEKIKKMGFLVKLDTNGSFPTLLKRLVNLGLIDYVAMDLKNSPAKYAPTAGVSSLDNEKIEESVSFLLSHVVPYEFRTTIVEEFHAASDIEAIAKWIQGDSKYYLQQFVDSGDLIQKGLQ